MELPAELAGEGDAEGDAEGIGVGVARAWVWAWRAVAWAVSAEVAKRTPGPAQAARRSSKAASRKWMGFSIGLPGEVWKGLLKERLSSDIPFHPPVDEVLAAGPAPATAHSIDFRNRKKNPGYGTVGTWPAFS